MHPSTFAKGKLAQAVIVIRQHGKAKVDLRSSCHFKNNSLSEIAAGKETLAD
jgi:hypothetical protein